MVKDFTYRDLHNHGDTARDPYTGKVCFLIHISYSKTHSVYNRVWGMSGCSGFVGYARNSNIYVITNIHMDDFIASMIFGPPRAILIEKIRPLYVPKLTYDAFAEANGVCTFLYEGHRSEDDI